MRQSNDKLMKVNGQPERTRECYNVTTPLGMPCPARFGHLKKLNKKGTHVKIFRINMPVSYINFCWPKVQGKGFFSNKLLTQECRLLTSCGKD